MSSISAAEYAIVVIVGHTFLLSTFGVVVVTEPCEVLGPFFIMPEQEREIRRLPVAMVSGAVRSKHADYFEFRHHVRDAGAMKSVPRPGLLESPPGRVIRRRRGKLADGHLSSFSLSAIS